MKIVFKVKYEGEGIVNYGSKDGVPKEDKSPYANQIYARSFVDRNGVRTVYVSSVCIKGAILGYTGNNWGMLPDKLKPVVYSSWKNLLRGWMNAEGGNNFRKASPLTITSAICSEAGGIVNEIHSSGGVKGENSLYYKENHLGGEYSNTIELDCDDLLFMPLEPTTDRLGLPESIYASPEFGKAFEKEFGVKLGGIGLYGKKGDLFHGVERGLLFDQAVLNKCAKNLYKSIQQLSINRSGGYLKCKSVEAFIEKVPGELIPWDGTADLPPAETSYELASEIGEQQLLAQESYKKSTESNNDKKKTKTPTKGEAAKIKKEAELSDKQ